MIEIKIVDIKSPGHFFCREVESESSSDEHQRFLQLQEDINNTFNQEQTVQISYIPAKNDICVGFRHSDRKWYRVRNDGVYARKHGQEACCFLVDIGETESINIRWLRKIPKKYLDLPFQIKECCVFGLKALTLQIHEDLSISNTTCVRWDDSATTFMEQCVKRSTSAHAEVFYTDSSGRMHIKLYLNDKGKTYNFNDLLVENQYGVYDELDGQLSPEKKKTTMTRNTKHLAKQLAEAQKDCLSDTEIRDLKIPSIYSDSEERRTPYYMSDNDCSKQRTQGGRCSDNPVTPSTKINVENFKSKLNTSGNNSADLLAAINRSPSQQGYTSECDNRLRPNSSIIVSHSDTESLSRGRSLTLSQSVLSRGRSPPGTAPLPPTPSLSRGRGQLDKLLQAISTKLPPSPSSASDIDSDSRMSPNSLVQSSLFDKMTLNQRRVPQTSEELSGVSPKVFNASPLPSKDLGGVRPKVYTTSPVPVPTAVPGQFEDSESDSSQTKPRTGLTMNSLLHSDPNVPLTRCRLPKAVLSKISKSSGSDTDSDTRASPRASRLSELSSVISREETKQRDSLESPQKTVRFSENITSSPSSGAESSPSRKKNKRPAMTEEEKRRSDMISQQQGNQLLNILKPSINHGMLGGVSLMESPPVRVENLDYVLIHSLDTVKPIIDMKDAPVGRLMKEAYRKRDYAAPQLIQSYSWKCILRGMNFVGLSPPNSGKTLAYLVPIISQLLNSGRYNSLPKGSGPYAIILVSSWNAVRKIFIEALSLLQGERNIRIIDLFGAGEDLKMCPLINGCELLIATPPSLKRVLELKYVHLNRLCHLVIDDADETLTEFTMEIREITVNYFRELSRQEDRSAPQQILLFGTQWEHIVQNYVQSYMVDPTIVMTSRYEASLYGKVKQVPIVCRKHQKPNEFLNILTDIVKDGCRLIIFVSEVNLAHHVHKLLESVSMYTLIAHHDMDKFAIEEISSNWHCDEREAILIATDLSIHNLYIKNATTIIHYDLPDSKTKFGNRMSCMTNYYWNFLKKDEEQVILPTSYILLTEESTDKIDTISRLLQRSKVKMPKELKLMLAGRKQEKNLDKEKKLCSYLKAFGTCRHEDRCRDRHLIIPDIDGKTTHTSGYVKIRITNIENASLYYGIIQEQESLDGTVTNKRCDYTDLMFQIQSYYTNCMNRRRHTNMCPGDICAYEANEIFHRVKILDLNNMNSSDGGIMADVFYVDDGSFVKVEARKLYDLPQKLKQIPFQAVEVFICRVKPIDSDQLWVPRASMFMHQLIEHKELKGRIVLSIENTLWLDPLVEEIELTSVKTKVRKMNVRLELMKNGFADDNPKHLDKLRDLCKGKIEVPEIREIQRSEKVLSVEILKENSTFHEVYVPVVDQPNLLFLTRRESNGPFERMMDSFNSFMDRPEHVKPFTETDVVDCVCAAEYSDDNRWNRVRVLSETDDGNVEIFYGDYGEKRTIPRNDLYQLPEQYWDLPFQAIECEMAYVQPRGDDWDEESGNSLWDLTHMVNEDKKLLMAKIISKSQAVYAGLHKYEVELFDTETSDDVNISQELVWSGVASPKPNAPLQEMCPLPPQGRKVYKSTIQKIPDLCAVIYWEKITEKAKSAPKEILKIVKHNVSSAPLDLIGYKALAAVIKLIGRISDPVSHNCILECLFCAARASQRLQDEIIEQECEIGVAKCLEQNSRPDIQEQAVIAIDKFLEINHSKFFPLFGRKRTIEILCQLLEVSDRNQTLLEIYTALTSLCAVKSKICDWVHSFEVCSTVQMHLETITDVVVLEAAMKYVIKLMAVNPEQLRKDKLIRAVVGLLDKTPSDKCILYGVQLCDNFCHNIRKNKTLLLEYRLVVILNKILASNSLSFDTRQQCKELHQSLAVQVPQNTTITNRPTHHQEETQEGDLPPVHWVQNTFRIVVTIKVKGITDCNVHFTTRSFDFRAVVDGKLHHVYYELFDEINTTLCKYEVKGSEARISLRKVEKGKWPRLLKEKVKPSNLSVDYERYVDSDSDSEVCDDEKPFVLKKKKKKSLPKNLTAPADKREVVPNDSGSSDSDSEESDVDVKFKSSADYDRYNLFD